MRDVHHELEGKYEEGAQKKINKKKIVVKRAYSTIALEQHNMRHLMIAIQKQLEHENQTDTWDAGNLAQRRTQAEQKRTTQKARDESIAELWKEALHRTRENRDEKAELYDETPQAPRGWFGLPPFTWFSKKQ